MKASFNRESPDRGERFSSKKRERFGGLGPQLESYSVEQVKARLVHQSCSEVAEDRLGEKEKKKRGQRENAFFVKKRSRR